NQDEESSGVIDVSDILGPGAYLLDVQAHYQTGDPELVEGGQFLLLRVSGPTAGLLDGNVVVHGSPNADVVTVALDYSNRVALVANGLYQTFDRSAVQAVTVAGSDGNDVITVDPRLTVNALLRGGAGNDVIFSGSGNDLVLGDDGNDTLVNLGGADVLIGGRGFDTVLDLGDGSILIGGAPP